MDGRLFFYFTALLFGVFELLNITSIVTPSFQFNPTISFAQINFLLSDPDFYIGAGTIAVLFLSRKAILDEQ